MKKFVWFFQILLVVILVGGGIFAFQKYQEAQREIERLSETPLASGSKEAEILVEKVGSHIVLPEGEQPIIATVTDVEKLRETQSFFKNAKNGDKVLIYQDAKKAFLYDPQSDKIVDVGFVNFNEQQDQNGLTKEDSSTNEN